MKTQTLKQEEVPAKKPALTNGSSPSNDIDTLSNAKPTVVTDAAIRQRISSHSADLHDLYFSMRSKAMIGGDRDEEGLEEFSSGEQILHFSFKAHLSLNAQPICGASVVAF